MMDSTSNMDSEEVKELFDETPHLQGHLSLPNQIRRRLTIQDVNLTLSQVSMVVEDTTDQSVNTEDALGEAGSEPGSPVFHNAIIFQSQVQLNQI